MQNRKLTTKFQGAIAALFGPDSLVDFQARRKNLTAQGYQQIKTMVRLSRSRVYKSHAEFLAQGEAQKEIIKAAAIKRGRKADLRQKNMVECIANNPCYKGICHAGS